MKTLQQNAGYAAKNFVALAKRLTGFAGSTRAGAIRALIRRGLVAAPCPGFLYLDAEPKPRPMPYGIEIARPLSQQRGVTITYLAAEKARQADPEAKRARRDVIFRRNYLRRLNAETSRLISPPVNTLDQISAAAGSFGKRSARLVEITRLKNIATGKKQNAPVPPKTTAGIKVGGFDAAFAKKMGVHVSMIGKNATLTACRAPSWGRHVDAVPSVKKNGKWRGFERAEHHNYVRSFALILPDGSLDYIFHNLRARLSLPPNARWDVDTNGLRIVSGPDDYHVTAPDLCAKNAVEKLMARLAERAETRRQFAAQHAVELAEMAGVYVCVADAIRAGNCLAGTLSFAQRHSLDPKRHYSATELLTIGNGDIGRVRLAIRAACNRHAAECDRGFALLADHTIA